MDCPALNIGSLKLAGVEDRVKPVGDISSELIGDILDEFHLESVVADFRTSKTQNQRRARRNTREFLEVTCRSIWKQLRRQHHQPGVRNKLVWAIAEVHVQTGKLNATTNNGGCIRSGDRASYCEAVYRSMTPHKADVSARDVIEVQRCDEQLIDTWSLEPGAGCSDDVSDA